MSEEPHNPNSQADSQSITSEPLHAPAPATASTVKRKNRHAAGNVKEQCQRFICKCLTLPHVSFSAASLGKELKMSRQMVSYYMKRMTHLGLLKVTTGVWPPMYTLTEKAKKINVKDFSYSTTMFDIDEKIGMEDVYITIPRDPNCTGNLPDGFWEKINLKMNNNVQKHGHVNLGDYNCSIRETSQSVVIQLGPVKLTDFRQAYPIYNELVFRLFELLMQYNYFIDPTKARCSDPEFTYSNPFTRENAKMLTEPRIVERLGFPREKMLPGDQPEEAWVKVDNSPAKGTIETNHLPLAEAWKALPLAIMKLLELQTNQTAIMGKYAAEIEAHLDTYAKVNEAFSDLKAAYADNRKFNEDMANSFKAAISAVQATTQPAAQKPAQDAIISTLEAMQDWERVRVRITRNMREFTFNDASGQSKFIPQLKAGSEVYVSRDQAIDLVRWKEAEVLE